MGRDHGSVVSERLDTPLCRMCKRPSVLFVPMTGEEDVDLATWVEEYLGIELFPEQREWILAIGKK